MEMILKVSVAANRKPKLAEALQVPPWLPQWGLLIHPCVLRVIRTTSIWEATEGSPLGGIRYVYPYACDSQLLGILRFGFRNRRPLPQRVSALSEKKKGNKMLRIRERQKRQMGISGKSAQILRYPSVWVFERAIGSRRPGIENRRRRRRPVCSGGSLRSILQLHKNDCSRIPFIYRGCRYLLVCPLYTCSLSVPSLSLLPHSKPLPHSPSALSVSLTLHVVSSSMAPVPNHLPPAWVMPLPASLAPCCQSWHLLSSSFCGICPSFLL